jgi:hypothetical protein
MARRSHRCGNGLVVNPDLKRFLDRQLVMLIFETAIGSATNDLSWSNSVGFHRSSDNDIILAVEICHLYISPGHNFFGHHGREPDNYAAVEVDSVQCVAGRGIRDDRFFDYRDDYKGQITFFSLEVFDELCSALQVQGVDPSSVRRNVLVRGVDLNSLIGKKFEVQGVHFYGTEESRPCHWMNDAVAAGTEEFLKGHGGLRARILTDGVLKSTSRVAANVE